MKLESLLVITSPICLSYAVPQIFEVCDMFKKRYKLIHVATRKGYATIVRKLIENGCDIEAKQKFGLNPLQLAACYGKLNVVKVLIEMGADVDSLCGGKWKQTALFDAVYQENEEIIRFLIENKANVNAEDYCKETPLFKAVYRGFERIVKLLLENGADPNFSNDRKRTPLFYAESDNITKMLTDYKANIDHKDEEGYSPITLATLMYKPEDHKTVNTIKILTKNGADINTQPPFPYLKPLIHKALEHSDIKMLQFLISNGADINLLDSNQRTPLFPAIQSKFEEGIKILIANGTEINSKDANGNTPLILAIETDSRFIEYLIKSGADVNTRNNFLQTPLHATARRGNIEALELLIENGGNIDAKTSAMQTPLEFAAKNNQAKIVRLLLECGTPLNSKNVRNLTSMEHSLESMCFESLKTLLGFAHMQ